MSDPVYIPPSAARRRDRGMWFPPLLIVSFIFYNIFAFTVFGGNPDGWNNTVFGIPMVSGEHWEVTAQDLMIAFSLLMLFFEVIKSTRTGTSSVLEHMLSTLVFILFLVEFLLIGAAASSLFFILMLMSLFDVVAGFTVSITAAGRDVTLAN
jgi:hypothetical protein